MRGTATQQPIETSLKGRTFRLNLEQKKEIGETAIGSIHFSSELKLKIEIIENDPQQTIRAACLPA